MSRIERYQQSIEKFINNKNTLEENIKNNIVKLDHLSGIILSSIISNNAKKTNFKVHGYYMSIAIDLLYYIVELQNLKDQNNNNILNLFNTVYHLFQLNIESLKIPSKQEINYNKLISFIFSYLNTKLFSITKQYEFNKLNKLCKNDIIKLNYITDEFKKKLKNMLQILNEDLMKYINNTYGNIGTLVFIIGWTLGGGELKPEILKDLQIIGENYGVLYKLCIDFENILKDINLNSKYCLNLVINLGIQESFSLFMTTKTKLIELCLKNNIYSHTIKEVIDLLENKIDKCLKNAEIDMNSTYSTYSSVSK